MFSEIIKSFRMENGLSQTAFVEILQRSSENFYNLDTVTLSRWERGTTKPHLGRQNELLSLIGVNIFDEWKKEPVDNTLKKIENRINCNTYINNNFQDEMKIIKIDSSNSYILADYLNELEAIVKFENNLIFNLFLDKESGIMTQLIFDKIINEYSGEVVLVIVSGQLIGHLISAGLNIFDLVPEVLNDTSVLGYHVIISFNVTDIRAMVPTIGREIYKYLQSLNPSIVLYLIVENKRVFDIFYNLGFEYKSVINNSNNYRLMNINSEIIKSNKVWMTIISSYKGDKNE